MKCEWKWIKESAGDGTMSIFSAIVCDIVSFKNRGSRSSLQDASPKSFWINT